MDKFDKYILLVARLKKRYTVNGMLIFKVGEKLSKYSLLEIAAFNKYLL